MKMNRKVIVPTFEKTYNIVNIPLFSEKHTEVGIFLIIIETNLVDTVEVNTEEIPSVYF